MSTQPKTRFTAEEYLAIERAAECKSEYFGGEIFAIAGASEEHVLLMQSMERLLYGQLTRGCRVYSSDMRVHVPATGLFTYPDVTVACGRQFLDSTHDTQLNPIVIVEVLSPSTEAYDRGRKFENYQSIESFQQYVLISQDRIRVDVYTRQQAGGWLLTPAAQLTDTIELSSVGCTVPMAELYGDLDFGDASKG